MADSGTMQVGDPVVIVGAPYGLSYSVSAGLISARWAPNTVYKTMPMAEFFQTDATINTGNSGGPMFNMNGEIIGIVSHNISKGGGSEGLGFVVTMNTAKQLLFLDKRSVWAGLEGLFLDDELADLLNLPARSSGYIVKTVAKGSPGDQIGLRGSRMIVRIAGQDVPLGGDIILSVGGLSASPANLANIQEHARPPTPGHSLQGVGSASGTGAGIVPGSSSEAGILGLCFKIFIGCLRQVPWTLSLATTPAGGRAPELHALLECRPPWRRGGRRRPRPTFVLCTSMPAIA